MLYKYFALEEERHFEWLSDLLISGKIFFCRAARFNDPNEFRFQFRAPKDKKIIQATWQRDNPTRTTDEFEAWLSSTSLNSWHIYLEPLFHRHFLDAFGLVCFSETPDNPTMWAHYANDHRGVCVGFENLSVGSFSGIKMSGKVKYQKKLPIVKYFGEDQKAIIYKIFFSKCADWRYEREYRLVADADITLTMNPAAIHELILGMHMDQSNKERVRKLVSARKSPIPVRTAHLSYATYQMEIT